MGILNASTGHVCYTGGYIYIHGEQYVEWYQKKLIMKTRADIMEDLKERFYDLDSKNCRMELLWDLIINNKINQKQFKELLQHYI